MSVYCICIQYKNIVFLYLYFSKIQIFHLPITVEWLLTLVLEIHLWYLASVCPSHCSVEADKLIHTVSVSSLWWCQVSVIYPFKEIKKKVQWLRVEALYVEFWVSSNIIPLLQNSLDKNWPPYHSRHTAPVWKFLTCGKFWVTFWMTCWIQWTTCKFQGCTQKKVSLK